MSIRRKRKLSPLFSPFLTPSFAHTLSLFSLPFSFSLFSLPTTSPPPPLSPQNLMKLGHNKSLALEAFVRENAPASPSGPSLPPPSSLGGGGGGAGAKNSSSAKFQLQLKPRPARSFREWQAGIALFAGGNVFNFVSFGFAAQSLLAALGSVQFVSNVVFARLVLKEAVTWRVLCATALIVTGESGERKREEGRSWRRKGKKRKKKKTHGKGEQKNPRKKPKQAASCSSLSATTAPSS